MFCSHRGVFTERARALEVAVLREGLVARVVLPEGKVVAMGAAVKVAATGEAARVVVARAVVARGWWRRRRCRCRWSPHMVP